MYQKKSDWIPREYYAAVRFAAKMVRETGWFNKAVRTAANYYDVDEEMLGKYLNTWTHSSPKLQQRPKGFKMKWFIVETKIACDANPEWNSSYSIAYGKTAETVADRYREMDFRFDRQNDYGGSYAPYRVSEVIGEYSKKDEAVTALQALKEKRARSDNVERK